jgi:hypothetical protein
VLVCRTSAARFHDRLWLEGNVPFSLQRWELLDDDSDLRRIAELAPAQPSSSD